MNYEIEFDEAADSWCVSLKGEITAHVCKDIMRAAWEHPGYAGAARALWDLTQCEILVEIDEINDIVTWVSRNKQGRGPSKVALIAPDDLKFGTSRVYAGLQDMYGFEINIFRSREAASGWLKGV